MGKIKDHIVRNKEAYIAVGSGMAGALLAIFTIIIMKELRTTPDAGIDSLERESADSFNFAKSFFGSATNNVVTIHSGHRGHSGFVTRCIETGQQFTTQASAARYYGIPESIMSKHLNFGRELLEDLHFERVQVIE